MNLNFLLCPEAIIENLHVTSKKQALQEIARRAAQLSGLEERVIFDMFLQRERLGSTGVGGGIAIPHGKIAELDRTIAVFVRLSKPIEFDAIDDQPVDLLMALIAPTDAGADHLKALSRVSRVLRDKVICEKLRGSDTADAIYGLLTDDTISSHAA